MRERCPSAKFVAVAEFLEHRLAFTRKSRDRGCGVSDVVPDISANVWGVVYEIAETEIGLLDRREGYRPGRERTENSYNREERHVLRDGNKNEPLLVSIYIGIPQNNPPKPNAEYKKLLVGGATRWQLPPEYIEKLKQILTED